jgi:hypothetical protein
LVSEKGKREVKMRSRGRKGRGQKEKEKDEENNSIIYAQCKALVPIPSLHEKFS